MDRDRNENVHRRAGKERELVSRVDQRVLRWFMHVEKMDEYHMARRVLMVEVSGMGQTEVRLDEWHEGGLPSRNDGGGCVTMHKI